MLAKNSNDKEEVSIYTHNTQCYNTTCKNYFCITDNTHQLKEVVLYCRCAMWIKGWCSWKWFSVLLNKTQSTIKTHAMREMNNFVTWKIQICTHFGCNCYLKYSNKFLNQQTEPKTVLLMGNFYCIHYYGVTNCIHSCMHLENA